MRLQLGRTGPAPEKCNIKTLIYESKCTVLKYYGKYYISLSMQMPATCITLKYFLFYLTDYICFDLLRLLMSY